MTKRNDRVEIVVVRSKGAATLVESQDSYGNPTRISVPSDSVELSDDGKSGKIDSQDLKMGIDYGIPWEFRLRSQTFSSVDMSNALHRNGIWTSEDVVGNPDSVKGALLEVFRQTLSDINQVAKEFRSKET